MVVAALGLGAWGWWAASVTPIDAIPDLSDNQVIVFTEWPGHSPQEVEDQLTYPLTVNLQGLAGARVVRSQSAFGFSMVYVIFADDVDLYLARARVLGRMSLITQTLPPGVVPTLGPDATGVGPRVLVHRRFRLRSPGRSPPWSSPPPTSLSPLGVISLHCHSLVGDWSVGTKYPL